MIAAGRARLRDCRHTILGYGSVEPTVATTPEVPREQAAYEQRQQDTHDRLVRDFLLPQIGDAQVATVLDLGCGIGGMVMALVGRGYDAYGVDLAATAPAWASHERPRDRFFVVGTSRLELPFDDESFDFVFSLGVIEHIGTTNGHSDRRPDYHDVRRQWLREAFRTVRRGGRMLIGGPNRNFPVDHHGPDSRASALEKRLAARLGFTLHRTWGENFLWGFGDFARYLEGLDYDLDGVRMAGYYRFARRTPWIVRPFFRMYVERLPRPLLRTGFNPWATALIRRR